jgi:hypothetical protein
VNTEDDSAIRLTPRAKQRSATAKYVWLGFALSLLAGCSSLPPAARPGVWAAGAVVAASVLFYVGAKEDSSDPPADVGCFERIEGNRSETICPP